MIFLIHGKAKSGKDTVADYLVKKFNAKKLWYAKAIKDYAMKYFHFTHDEVYHKKNVHSRRALLGIGDMFRDKVNQFYWLNLMISKIVSEVIHGQMNFVLSDCRLEEEIVEIYRAFYDVNKIFLKDDIVDYMRIRDGCNGSIAGTVRVPEIECYSISVTRENCPDIECGADHSTENDLNDFKFDIVINNNGTIGDLHLKLDKTIDILGL